jgi:predicted DNA binding CopG/RHH family protein
MPKKPEMTKTSLRVPSDLLRRAKHYCVDHDVDFQDLVAAALETYLKGAKA